MMRDLSMYTPFVFTAGKPHHDPSQARIVVLSASFDVHCLIGSFTGGYGSLLENLSSTRLPNYQRRLNGRVFMTGKAF